jgi:hypothetical protein
MGACLTKSDVIVSEHITRQRTFDVTKVKATMLVPYSETREITPETKTI